MTKTLHKHGFLAIVLVVAFTLVLTGVCFAMASNAAIALADPEPVDLDADAGVPVAFYNYDGSLISVEYYEANTGFMNVPSETVVPDPSWDWEQLGWRCNACGAVVTGDNVAGWDGNTPPHILTSPHSLAPASFTVAYNTNGNDVDHITFEPIISQLTGDNYNEGVISRVIDITQSNTVTVSYNIVHNDGINEIVLVPDYDKTAFTLTQANVVPKNNTALGAATVTGTQVDADEIRIAWENNGNKYTTLDTAFLTLTFTVNNNAIANGLYDFGLDLAESVAYYDDGDTKLGEHVNVPIWLNRKNSLLITRMQQPEIVIGYNYHNVFVGYDNNYNEILEDQYRWEYAKQPAATEEVSAMAYASENSSLDPEGFDPAHLTAYYTYKDVHGNAIQSDGGAITTTWYHMVNDEWVAMLDEFDAPTSPSVPGEYRVSVAAAASAKYYAVPAVTRTVVIMPRHIYVDINDQESAYGDPIKQLTYSQSGVAMDGDTVTITVSTGATSSSAPGDYGISGSAVCSPEYYIVVFRRAGDPDSNAAVYTITKKTVSVTANDQSVEYTGSTITPDQSEYTLTGAPDGTNVSILTKKNDEFVDAVNPGSYTLVPVVDLSSVYYNIQVIPGTLTVTSAAKIAAYFEPYFAGLTVTYNGNEQDLLNVTQAIEEWWAYAVSNNMQTNANAQNQDYVITITVTVKAAYAEYYSITGGEAILTVNGHINPAPIVIRAVDQSSAYGSTPVSVGSFAYTVTSGTLYNGDNLNVTYGGAGSAITAQTAVGNYPITMSANNGNYVITTNPGTYTVNKGQATAYYAEILDTKYNRTNSAEIIERIANHNAPDSQYDESYTWAKVGNQDILSTATYAVYDSDNQLVPADQVMECATYKFVMTVPGTANYDGVVLQNYFKIYKIKVHAPVVTYDGTQVTVTPYTYPTQDAANIYGKMTDADNWPLFDESLVVITINGVVGSTYVPTSAAPDGLTYSISAGSNYEPYVGTTVAVFSVSFDEGIHAANPSGEVSNMPETQYVFAGQSATAPATNPSIVGCNFEEWQVGGVAYAFTEEVSANTTVVAIWSAVQYTVTFKYFDDADTLDTNVFEVLVNHNDNITLPTMSPAHPTESGKQYVFNNTWSDGNATYGVVEGKLAANNEPIIVTSNGLVFVAQYDVTYGVYTITYYFSENESTTNYTQYGDVQSVTYGDPIQYVVFDGNDYAWFKTDYWYLNAERTQGVPSTMPAEDIYVYGSYKFDIGTGDVNANGVINADDITLYRQWIVGGYIMNVIAAGSEWDTVTDANFDADDNYFLARVADNNDDAAKDIRDVSIIRMAIVGNYDWDIVVGDTVSGAAIQRAKTSYTIAALQNGLNSGRARLHADIESDTADIVVNSTGSVYLDLGGYTLTVKSLTISVSGKDATITITNGTISAEDGITIVAPNGNVIIENVTAYVDGTQINLQAANNSLHFAGTVAFYDGNITDANPEPAVINVENGTHVVIEKAADVVVDKVVVTENFVESSTATITINNNSTVVTVVTVEGKATNEINSIASMVAAFANGGEYVLTADVVYNGSPTVTANTVLDLNGHLLRSANNVAIFVGNGARLTINGDATGRVIAQEAAVTVLDGSELIVNGGTFTAQDNFVFGTNGSTGRGGNKITVNGGVINGNIQSAGYVACGIYVANSDVVVVNGGTFNVVNGCGILARSGNTTVGANVVFNVEGSGNLGKVGDSQVTVPTGKALVLDLAAGYPGGTPSITNNSAAEVTTVNGVSTFAQLSAATGYVVLTANINAGNSDIVYSNDVNISLNGKTITFGKWGFEVRNGATLTINGNGVVNATEACLYAQYAGHLVVNGGTFISTNNFVIGTNGNAGRGGNTIVVNGGTFNGDMSEAARTNNNCIACGIYVANDDTLTVNAGTFNVTDGVGIIARSGNTTVGANVVLNVSGNGTAGRIGDSRVVVPMGEELVLDLAAGYPGGTPSITNNSSYSVYTVNA